MPLDEIVQESYCTMRQYCVYRTALAWSPMVRSISLYNLSPLFVKGMKQSFGFFLFYELKRFIQTVTNEWENN